ncbi:MAG: N-acetylmannosamine-6-phosphate 2-epimerase [Peptostreptococcaceae bacterium]|nr:N-acetylmannosamine-6-phosphate 2-epimerase [Peptostreptococcaceae bacterium]
MDKVEKIKGALVVSCQALQDEPLHSSFIMGRMARAAEEGGACGIRANSVEDIAEIKKNTDLPIIGIIKKNYEGSSVYITPTMEEVDQLVAAGVEIIAMHATDEIRPDGSDLEGFFAKVKSKYPNQLFMADCSTPEELLKADELGFDFLGTTLVGYTAQSRMLKIEDNDFEIIRDLLAKTQKPVIAEGNIDSPEKARRVLELGCYSVVVGSSITRPQLITKKYVEAIERS